MTESTKPITMLKKICALFIALPLFVVTLPAIAGYNVWTNEYSFSQPEIQSAVDTAFPLTIQGGGFFQLSGNTPVVTFDGRHNRLNMHVTLRVSGIVLSKPVSGQLELASGLKYVSGDRTLRLDHPAIISVNFPDLPANQRDMVIQFASAAIVPNIDGLTIYKFSPEQLRYEGKDYEPDTITVNDDALVVGIKMR